MQRRVVGSCNGDVIYTIETCCLLFALCFVKKSFYVFIMHTIHQARGGEVEKFQVFKCDPKNPKNIFREKMPKIVVLPHGKFIDPWDGIRDRVGDGREKNLVVTKLGYMEKSKQTYVLSSTTFSIRVLDRSLNATLFLMSRKRCMNERNHFEQDTGLFTYQGSYTSSNSSCSWIWRDERARS